MDSAIVTLYLSNHVYSIHKTIIDNKLIDHKNYYVYHTIDKLLADIIIDFIYDRKINATLNIKQIQKLFEYIELLNFKDIKLIINYINELYEPNIENNNEYNEILTITNTILKQKLFDNYYCYKTKSKLIYIAYADNDKYPLWIPKSINIITSEYKDVIYSIKLFVKSFGNYNPEIMIYEPYRKKYNVTININDGDINIEKETNWVTDIIKEYLIRKLLQ